MPLSEDEQRILHEIERNFYEQDPEFAKEVATETVYRHSGRIIRVAAIAFLAGLIILISQFANNVAVGFAGFLIMFGSGYVIERNVRRIGRAGLQEVTHNIREQGGLGDSMTSARSRLRRRFQRDED